MNVIDLLNEYRSVILEDPAVKAWCQLNYSRSANVFVGVNTNNPPDENEYPLVHLFPVEKDVGIEADEKLHVIGCTCGVHVDGDAENVYEDGHKLKGIVHLEEFRNLVQAALVRSEVSGVYISRIRSEYETVDFYPFFLVGMELSVKQPTAFRDDPFD